MSWFSDAVDSVSCVFESGPEPEPEVAPPPAAPPTPSYSGAGGGSPQASAEAFSHYAEEPLQLGLIAPDLDEIHAMAAMKDLSPEMRDQLRVTYREKSNEPLPTGLLTPEEIDAAYAESKSTTQESPPAKPRVQDTHDEDASADRPPDERARLREAPATKPSGPPTEEARLLETMKTGDPAAVVKASTELMNLKLAEAKATELLAIAKADAKKSGFDSALDLVGINDLKDQMESSLEGLPPEVREQAIAKLGTMGGEAGLPEGALDEAREANDAVTLSEKADARRKKKIDDTVASAEAAAKSGKPGALTDSLDKLSPKQREKALDQMTPEAREVAEDELAKRRKRLEKIAERLEKAQHGTGATDATDEVGMITNLSGLTKSEAKELQEIYGEKFKDDDGEPRSLKDDLHDELDEDGKEYELVTAVMNGDVEEADKLSVELAVTYIEDEAEAWIDADEGAMNKLLRAHGKNPDAAAAIADAYFKKTGKQLTVACEDVMDAAEFKEAAANIRGDRRTANVAVLEQGDSDRSQMVVEEVQEEEGGVEQLARDTQEHTGQKLDKVLDGQLEPETAAAVEAQVTIAQDKIKEERDQKLAAAVAKLKPDELAAANKKAEEIAGKLSTELSKMHVAGNNTEVTDPLVGLSEAEVALVMKHYKLQGESLGHEDVDLEADLREKLDGKDLKVASAALSGNKVLTAVALVEQSADNHGTSVPNMRKAMATLKTPEERKAFKKLMSTHVGGDDAYDRLVKSETSSYERDELLAMGIVETNERAAAMAQVEVTKHAYGGKVATWMDQMGDAVGDTVGESDVERRKRRQAARKDGINFVSNLGGSEDAMLDAMAKLENPEQVRLFNQRMLEENGETAADTVASEMSDHHKEAGLKFADGDYEGAQAERMVAELDCYVDDREDAASLPFENVRISDTRTEEIKKIKDPKARDAALEKAKEEARRSLLEKANEAAQAAGYPSYLAMLGKELTPAQYAVATDRIYEGKVSDETALYAAGDTAIANLGKDTAKFYEVMQDKTPAQMKELQTKFEKAHPGLDFQEWVKSKATSAGECRDFEIMLEGNYARMSDKELLAADPSLLIKRVKDLHDAARGGADEIANDPAGNMMRDLGNKTGNLIADNIGNSGERLDGRMEAVKKLEAKLVANGSLSAEEQADLITHMRYMSGDQKAFTETKTSAATAIGETAGVVVELGVTAATGNTVLGTAAGGLTTMAVKGTLDPGRYSTDAAAGDLVKVAADTAGSALGAKIPVPVLGEAVEGAIGGLGQALGNTQNWSDPGKLFDAAGRAIVEQGASAAASALIEKIVGDGLQSVILGAIAEQLMTGDPSATFGDQLLDIAKSAAQDYASGAAEKYGKRHDKATGGDGRGNDNRDNSNNGNNGNNGGNDGNGNDSDGPPSSHGDDDGRRRDDDDPEIETREPTEAEAREVQDAVDEERRRADDDPEIEARELPEAEARQIEDDADAVEKEREHDERASEPHPANDNVDPRTGDPKHDGPKTLTELAAIAPERTIADPRELAAAKAKLADGQPLADSELRAVLDLAVEASRAGMEKEGVDIGDSTSLGGHCGPTQDRVAEVLAHALGPGAVINKHATHPKDSDFKGPAIDGSKLQSKDTSHFFTTVHMPDGRVFLVDPTNGQFAGNELDAAKRMVDAEGGAEAAAELAKRGYVELTPEVADAYGRAMTGKDEAFSPDDFATPNRVEEVSGGGTKDKSAVEHAKKQWDDSRYDDHDSDDRDTDDENADGRPADETPEKPLLDRAGDLVDTVFEAADGAVQKAEGQGGSGKSIADPLPGGGVDELGDVGDVYKGVRGVDELLRGKDADPKKVGDAAIVGVGKLVEFGGGAAIKALTKIPDADQPLKQAFNQFKQSVELRVPDLGERTGSIIVHVGQGRFEEAGQGLKHLWNLVVPDALQVSTEPDADNTADPDGGEPYVDFMEGAWDLDSDDLTKQSDAEQARDAKIDNEERSLADLHRELLLVHDEPEKVAAVQEKIAAAERKIDELRTPLEDTDGDYTMPEQRARDREMEDARRTLETLRRLHALGGDNKQLEYDLAEAEARARELELEDAKGGRMVNEFELAGARFEVDRLRVEQFETHGPTPELDRQLEIEEERVRVLTERLAEQEADDARREVARRQQDA